MSNLNQPSMTKNQSEFNAAGTGALKRYRQLVSGSDSILSWLGLELYYVLCAPLGGLPGLGLRSMASKLLFASVNGNPAIESGVTLRSPRNIHLGRGVIISKDVTLDARKSTELHPVLKIGDHSFIGSSSMILAKGGDIILGNAVNISTYCRIGSEANITIGDSVLISAYCYIGPANHRFDNPEVPIMEQGMEKGKGVTIGDNCWIGTRVTILDGVTIGRNSIIGAHSLVREDVPENSIVAGTPAKLIKQR